MSSTRFPKTASDSEMMLTNLNLSPHHDKVRDIVVSRRLHDTGVGKFAQHSLASGFASNFFSILSCLCYADADEVGLGVAQRLPKTCALIADGIVRAQGPLMCRKTCSELGGVEGRTCQGHCHFRSTLQSFNVNCRRNMFDIINCLIAASFYHSMTPGFFLRKKLQLNPLGMEEFMQLNSRQAFCIVGNDRLRLGEMSQPARCERFYYLFSTFWLHHQLRVCLDDRNHAQLRGEVYHQKKACFLFQARHQPFAGAKTNHLPSLWKTAS